MYGLIKNILSPDIINEALSLYRNSINQVEINGVVSERYVSGSLGEFVLSRYTEEEFKNIWNNIWPKLEEAIGKKVIPASFRILRYGGGGYIKQHKDSDSEYRGSTVSSKKPLSVIILLSKSGTGGEFYIGSGLIDMEPSDLVYFTHEHLHQVKQVNDGVRHSINVRCFMVEG
jgi:hypothetical protein